MSTVSRYQRVTVEWRALLNLAVPIIIAQLANTAMGFVDTVMAGRVSPNDLAAVALGNSVWLPIFLLMSGILLATTAKVAHAFGRGAELNRFFSSPSFMAGLGIGLRAGRAVMECTATDGVNGC